MTEEIVTQRVAHTSGPWSEHSLLTDREVKRCEPKDGSEPFNYRSIYIGSSDRVVAEAVMWMAGKNAGFDRVDNVEEQDANARLIIAAPDMLAALKRIVTAFDIEIARGHIVGGTWNSEIAQSARAAIEKAEGGK